MKELDRAFGRMAIGSLIALIVLLAAWAAQAGSRVEWEGFEGGPPFVFVLSEPIEEGDIATLTVTNNETHIWTTPGATTLELDGLRVGVIVQHRQNPLADTILVTPAPGFAAIPGEVTLEEGETVKIRITPAFVS